MKINLLIVLIVLTLVQCSKGKINVSNIYKTDNVGVLIGNTPNDDQWKNTSFTNSEISLFNELDTANLSGTQLAVINNSSYGFPNPFAHQIRVSSSFAQPLNGDLVLKYVIVNSKMKSVQKGCVRIYATSSINFTVQGNFNPGNYRLYFTYSSQGNEHFFKAWGNIQKV